MTCEIKKLGTGETIITCTRGRRTPQLCQTPGCRHDSVALCDYPTPGGKETTCSRRMCRGCRAPQSGKDVDLCPPHARMAPSGVGP